MKKQFGMFFLIGCGLALLVLGCNQQQKPTFDVTAMKQIIEEKNNRFTQAHITGDTTFLNNIFTKDAKAFPPNSDVVIGRAAISAVNSQWVNLGIKEFREETTAFYGNEEYLIDEGTYYVRYGKNNTIDKGKYLNVWKKEDGDWKMFTNMWNTSMPATATE
jgi:ketosteroid isomerase-like protein